MGIERISEFWPEWKVTGILGSGAFGKVYKAEYSDAGFPTYSAIKVISVPSSDAETDALISEGISEEDTKHIYEEAVKDFINEIKLMSALKGAPNIVIVDTYKKVEKSNGVGFEIFIRMELLKSFKDYLQNTKPSEEDVVKLGIDIATALETCQNKNIIHRDIKPANIFIDNFGNFKLGDFGIAKELEKTKSIMSAKGTMSYMAPEVAKGLNYDSTVDIYSLGLVMYTLLNNNLPPFAPPNASNLNFNERNRCNEKRISGISLPPPCNASKELSNIILTACAFDPSKRFKSASAFKNALVSYRDTKTFSVLNNITDRSDTVEISQYESKKDSPVTNPTQKKSRKKFVVLTAILSVVFVSVILFMIIIGSIIGLINNKDDPNVTDDTSAIPDTDVLNESYPPETDTSAVTDIVTETSESKAPSDEPASMYNIGDTINMGNYEQDNILSNGNESIEWTVLDIVDNKALIICNYGLDSKQFNTYDGEVSWENSSLRQWLNEEFYNSAFSSDEKHKISFTDLYNPDNPIYGTDGGSPTTDKIFVPSIDEYYKYFPNSYSAKCMGTKYAELNGTYVDKNDNKACNWLLRTPGSEKDRISSVYSYGDICYEGDELTFKYFAVRPAMWIYID